MSGERSQVPGLTSLQAVKADLEGDPGFPVGDAAQYGKTAKSKSPVPVSLLTWRKGLWGFTVLLGPRRAFLRTCWDCVQSCGLPGNACR